LAADGVRELIIVAQDTTYYGMDLYGEPRLAELLRRLEQVEGVDWIRLMYFYPMYITDELIDVIAHSRKIVPYIDMPLQHASDGMLKRMARRVTRSETEHLLEAMRQRIENLAVRTTFITGFPGETDEQFNEMVEFVQKHKFERMGVFTYSPEPGTPAMNLDEHLPEEVMNARRDKLMEVQKAISYAWNQKQVGRTVDVILDQPVPNEKNVWVGRSWADAPDVDGLVFVTGDHKKLHAGDLVPVEIVAVQEYDLIGVVAGAPKPRRKAKQPEVVAIA
jgi:ribosomal protein S12 methylthiotransferase